RGRRAARDAGGGAARAARRARPGGGRVVDGQSSMTGGEAQSLLEAIFAGADAVLSVHAERWSAALPSGSVRAVSADELSAPATPAYAGALVAELDARGPRALVEAAAARVRPGGVIAIAAPTERAGLEGMRGRVLGVLRRRRPVPLEDLCEAMLLAGLVDVRAKEL